MSAEVALDNPAQTLPVRRNHAYIAGPGLDTVFLIAAPLVGVFAFLLFRMLPVTELPLSADRAITSNTVMSLFMFVFISAHLFIVFFRSHGNANVFKQYPMRFTLIPSAMLAAGLLSPVLLAIMATLSIWWDVYHSAMQTFGIGRIYDMKAGNNALAGRRLDQILNLLLYVGPILGGASLMAHAAQSTKFLIDYPSWANVFLEMPEYQSVFATVLLSIGVPFTIYYVYAYWQLARDGYQVSFQKVGLLACLAITSIVCWGFNTFGEAYFIMNFFHAWQYFFIVWFMEKKNITGLFRLTNVAAGKYIALALFIGLAVGFGLLQEFYSRESEGGMFAKPVIVLGVVVSLLHFWYDGFIWSVRKKQVQ